MQGFSVLNLYYEWIYPKVRMWPENNLASIKSPPLPLKQIYKLFLSVH